MISGSPSSVHKNTWQGVQYLRVCSFPGNFMELIRFPVKSYGNWAPPSLQILREKGLKVSTGGNQRCSVEVSNWSLFMAIWDLSNKLFISLRNARASGPKENKPDFCWKPAFAKKNLQIQYCKVQRYWSAINYALTYFTPRKISAIQLILISQFNKIHCWKSGWSCPSALGMLAQNQED